MLYVLYIPGIVEAVVDGDTIHLFTDKDHIPVPAYLKPFILEAPKETAPPPPKKVETPVEAAQRRLRERQGKGEGPKSQVKTDTEYAPPKDEVEAFRSLIPAARERNGPSFDRLAKAPMTILWKIREELSEQERLRLAQHRAKVYSSSDNGTLNAVIPNDISDWVRGKINPNSEAYKELGLTEGQPPPKIEQDLPREFLSMRDPHEEAAIKAAADALAARWREDFKKNRAPEDNE